MTREELGRLVRETWVEWAKEQPSPKPGWLTGWDELDDGQREVDMRIGEAVALAERQRLRRDLFDCLDCQAIHEPPWTGHDHTYRPRWRHRAGMPLADLIGDGRD